MEIGAPLKRVHSLGGREESQLWDGGESSTSWDELIPDCGGDGIEAGDDVGEVDEEVLLFT